MPKKPPMIKLSDGRIEPLDLSKSEHLFILSEEEILTTEGWKDEKDIINQHRGGFAYGMSQQQLVNVLIGLLEMKLSGKEITKQLQGLVNNRNIFCALAME